MKIFNGSNSKLGFAIKRSIKSVMDSITMSTVCHKEKENSPFFCHKHLDTLKNDIKVTVPRHDKSTSEILKQPDERVLLNSTACKKIV